MKSLKNIVFFLFYFQLFLYLCPRNQNKNSNYGNDSYHFNHHLDYCSAGHSGIGRCALLLPLAQSGVAGQLSAFIRENLKLKDEIEQLQDENNVLNEELEVVTGGQRERRSHQRKVQDPTIK